MKWLKAALEERADKKEDPLVVSVNAAKAWVLILRLNFLKQLFRTGYPEEAMTSMVLLQRFLTGLCPEISHQLLLHQKPANFSAALKDTMATEYALEFGGNDDTIYTVEQKQKNADTANTAALLDTLTKRLES